MLVKQARIFSAQVSFPLPILPNNFLPWMAKTNVWMQLTKVGFKWEMVLMSVSPVLDRLTAFVLKSFAQAKSHIFVEMSHITSALTWISQRQKENGCFQRSGSLLNNAIKVVLFILFCSLKTVTFRGKDTPVESPCPGDISLRKDGTSKASEIWQ